MINVSLSEIPANLSCACRAVTVAQRQRLKRLASSKVRHCPSSAPTHSKKEPSSWVAHQILPRVHRIRGVSTVSPPETCRQSELGQTQEPKARKTHIMDTRYMNSPLGASWILETASPQPRPPGGLLEVACGGFLAAPSESLCREGCLGFGST